MAAKKKTIKKSIKKTAKKTVPKKRISKKVTKLIKKIPQKKQTKTKKSNFVNASPEHFFWVCDGIVLKNLFDLETALENMSEDTYKHHVNPERNDFALWIRDILKEPGLALTLEKSKSKKETLKKIKTKTRSLK